MARLRGWRGPDARLSSALSYGDEVRSAYYIRFEGKGFESVRLVRFLYDQVASSLEGTEGLQGFLMTHGSMQFDQEEGDYLKRHGIQLDSGEAWGAKNECYVSGWTLGRLIYLEADQIDSAYESGQLLPTDILVTHSVPGEIPFLAGVVTLQPALPGSHVTLLAAAYDMPFIYLSDPLQVEALLALEGEEVLISSKAYCAIEISSLAAARIDEELREYLSDLRSTPPLEVTAKRRFGSYHADVAMLEPSDIAFFGGKAANFGFLLREIPENTRPYAVAFSMDLWDDYLLQEVEPGSSLGQWLDDTLSAYSWGNLDLPGLKADLKRARDLIEDETDFTEAQKQELLAALGGSEAGRRIRFRSSTNVEDAENYSGAGLYDSKTGCLQD